MFILDFWLRVGVPTKASQVVPGKEKVIHKQNGYQSPQICTIALSQQNKNTSARVKSDIATGQGGLGTKI